MTVEELKVKVANATEKAEKREKTIERHKAQAKKKLDIINKNGWELDDNLYRGSNYNYNALIAISEYKRKLEDITGAQMKLLDTMAILATWKAKLNEALRIEQTLTKEMPPIFLQCRDELAKQWTETDVKRREIMRDYKRNLGWEEFRKIYTYSKEDALQRTDEEFYKMELAEAVVFIIDLYNRVKDVTGTVTDWRGIHYNKGALNGIVIGESGTARVESILAGGYNIQRLHIRVLVHKHNEK